MAATKKSIVGTCVILCFIVLGCNAILPGIKTAITQSGLDYAKTVGLKYLQNHLASVTVKIPDQSGEKDSIQWTISNILIKDIKVPAGAISIDAGEGLTISTSAMSASLTADWYGREKVWPHPKSHGQAQVGISSTTASTILEFGTKDEKPAVTAANTAASIGGLDLHFSGSHLDFILNLLKGLFKDKIKDLAESGIASEINTAVDTTLNSILQSLPVQQQIDSISNIDYSLVSKELVGKDYLTLDCKGEFFSNSKPVEAPFSPAALPDVDTSVGGMMQVIVSEYTPSTAGFVYWKYGLFKIDITPDMVPAGSPVNLNTSTWGPLIPQLPKDFPGWLMRAHIEAVAPPVVTFDTSNGAGLLANFTVAMYAMSPTNDSSYPVFTLDIVLTSDLQASVQSNNITAKVTAINVSVSLMKTWIGNFDVTNIQQLISFALQQEGIPYINTYLSKGFPIPTVDGVTLVNPKLVFGNKHLVIIADIHYPPPASI